MLWSYLIHYVLAFHPAPIDVLKNKFRQNLYFFHEDLMDFETPQYTLPIEKCINGFERTIDLRALGTCDSISNADCIASVYNTVDSTLKRGMAYNNLLTERRKLLLKNQDLRHMKFNMDKTKEYYINENLIRIGSKEYNIKSNSDEFRKFVDSLNPLEVMYFLAICDFENTFHLPHEQNYESLGTIQRWETSSQVSNLTIPVNFEPDTYYALDEDSEEYNVFGKTKISTKAFNFFDRHYILPGDISKINDGLFLTPEINRKYFKRINIDDDLRNSKNLSARSVLANFFGPIDLEISKIAHNILPSTENKKYFDDEIIPLVSTMNFNDNIIMPTWQNLYSMNVGKNLISNVENIETVASKLPHVSDADKMAILDANLDDWPLYAVLMNMDKSIVIEWLAKKLLIDEEAKRASTSNDYNIESDQISNSINQKNSVFTLFYHRIRQKVFFQNVKLLSTNAIEKSYRLLKKSVFFRFFERFFFETVSDFKTTFIIYPRNVKNFLFDLKKKIVNLARFHNSTFEESNNIKNYRSIDDINQSLGIKLAMNRTIQEKLQIYDFYIYKQPNIFVNRVDIPKCYGFDLENYIPDKLSFSNWFDARIPNLMYNLKGIWDTAGYLYSPIGILNLSRESTIYKLNYDVSDSPTDDSGYLGYLVILSFRKNASKLQKFDCIKLLIGNYSDIKCEKILNVQTFPLKHGKQQTMEINTIGRYSVILFIKKTIFEANDNTEKEKFVLTKKSNLLLNWIFNMNDYRKMSLMFKKDYWFKLNKLIVGRPGFAFQMNYYMIEQIFNYNNYLDFNDMLLYALKNSKYGYSSSNNFGLTFKFIGQAPEYIKKIKKDIIDKVMESKEQDRVKKLRRLHYERFQALNSDDLKNELKLNRISHSYEKNKNLISDLMLQSLQKNNKSSYLSVSNTVHNSDLRIPAKSLILKAEFIPVEAPILNFKQFKSMNLLPKHLMPKNHKSLTFFRTTEVIINDSSKHESSDSNRAKIIKAQKKNLSLLLKDNYNGINSEINSDLIQNDSQNIDLQTQSIDNSSFMKLNDSKFPHYSIFLERHIYNLNKLQNRQSSKFNNKISEFFELFANQKNKNIVPEENYAEILPIDLEKIELILNQTKGQNFNVTVLRK